MATNLKQAVGRMNDVKELRELKQAVAARIGVLEERAYAAKVAEAWERTKDVQVGATLYVCAAGTFFGGPFQRGDSMKVTHVQPRAKRIWVDVGGKPYWFGAKGIQQYDLRTTAPEKPMDAEERKRVERMAGRIAEAIA